MALLALFLLIICAGVFMLWVPIQRYKEELPGEPLLVPALAQIVPTAVAAATTLAFRVDLPPDPPNAAQPAVDPVLGSLLVLQFAATLYVLSSTLLSTGKKIIYGIVSSFGALLVMLIIAYLAR